MFGQILGAVATGYMTKKIMEDEKKPGKDASLGEIKDTAESHHLPESKVSTGLNKIPLLGTATKLITKSRNSLIGALK